MVHTAMKSLLKFTSKILGSDRTLRALEKMTGLINVLESAKNSLPPSDITKMIVINGQAMEFRSYRKDAMNRPLKRGLKNWETKSLLMFSELSKSSRVILDIGSYTGIYAIVAAKSNPNAKVFAFEPNSELAPILKENISLNSLSNVAIEVVALGALEFTADLYIGNSSDTASIKGFGDASARKLEVKVHDLDTLLSRHVVTGVDLIKIDVEGYEIEVLEGMSGLLNDSHPILIIEALTMDELDKQREYLKKFGYLEPIQMGALNGDLRNYIWHVSASSTRVLRALTVL